MSRAELKEAIKHLPKGVRSVLLLIHDEGLPRTGQRNRRNVNRKVEVLRKQYPAALALATR
jgi:hypothetical protein